MLTLHRCQALRNLRALPSLKRDEAGDQDACPICLISIESIIEENEEAYANQGGSSGLSGIQPEAGELTGVVKLSLCGHIFCRKECV